MLNRHAFVLALLPALALGACRDRSDREEAPTRQRPGEPLAEPPADDGPPAPAANDVPAAPPGPDDAVLPPPTDLARASNRFAFALWARAGGGNTAISPASIATALTIAWGGAKGETAAQMRRILHLEGEPDELLSRWGALSRALQDDKRGLTLRVANRLYAERSYPVDTVYFGIIRKAFDVWIEPVDFSSAPDDVRVRINDWVAEQTAQRIKDFMAPGSITPDTKMVIVNAIYFLADWATPFDPGLTRPSEFYTGGKTKKLVPTMSHRGQLRHASAGGATLVDLPYAGDSASMYVVLPDARTGLASLEKKLEGTLKTLQQQLAVKTVAVQLPRFTIEPSQPMQLAKELQALGMVDAFGERADFTNIAMPRDERDRLRLSSVLHKAVVKVDERGTEAAAATASAGLGAGAAPQTVVVRVDRPFLFVIVDRTSGMILFIGRVVDPAA
jgi:serpin B